MNLAGYAPSNITKYMVGRIFALSWPVVGEMLCLVVGGVLTTAMVGRFGAVEVTAVGLATMLQTTCAMVISAAGTGAGALVARAYGARRLDEAQRIAGQALVIAVAASAAAAAFCYNAGRFLIAAASPDQAVVVMANGFLAVMAFFLPFMAVTSVCLASIRATGQTRVSMLVAVAGQFISLSITYTLLFVLKMGVSWAIAGMASSQALASVISFLAARSSLTLGLRLRHIYPWRREIIANVLKVSLAAAMEQVALQSGRIAFTLLMATAGAVQFAGHNVSLQIESISFMPGMAFGITAMTLVGYHLGRGQARRAKQYALLTCANCACVMSCFGILFYFCAEGLTRFFIDDPQVLAWGMGCVRVAAMEQVFLSVAMVLPGVLRGSGDAATSMYVAILGTWCFRIPAILFMKYLGSFDVVTGWFCAFLDMAIRAALFIYILRGRDWHKLKTGVYV
jgi:putative MATE family efflux protein